MNAASMVGRCMAHQDPTIALPPLPDFLARHEDASERPGGLYRWDGHKLTEEGNASYAIYHWTAEGVARALIQLAAEEEPREGEPEAFAAVVEALGWPDAFMICADAVERWLSNYRRAGL